MKRILGGLCSLWLCACGAQPEIIQPDNLADTQWVLTAYSTNTGVKNSPTTYATLDFKAGQQLTGETPCGAFSGTYQTSDGLVTISKLKSSGSNCGTAEQDFIYFNAMAAAKTYAKLEQQLTLSQADGQQLSFVKKFPGCSIPIAIPGVASNIVKIQIKNADVDSFIAGLEQHNPDFIIKNASSCTTGIVAQINPNTLAQLRCDATVASLTYQPTSSFQN